MIALILTLVMQVEAGQLKIEKDYYEKAQPVFAKYCSSCHNGASNLNNWLDYNTAIGNRDKIYFRVYTLGDMPWRLKISSKDKNDLASWLTMEVK